MALRHKPFFKSIALIMLTLVTFMLPTHLVSDDTQATSRTGASLSSPYLQAINTELLRSKELLRNNKVTPTAAADEVIHKIDILWQELQVIGTAERTGLDTEWRAAFVVIQSCVERALAALLNEQKIQKAHCILVAPRMSSPLFQKNALTLDQVQLSAPHDFSKLRKTTQEEFLKARGILQLVMSHDASTTVASERLALYQSNLEKFAGCISLYGEYELKL